MDAANPRCSPLYEQAAVNSEIHMGTFRLAVDSTFAAPPESDGLLDCTFVQRFGPNVHLYMSVPGSPNAFQQIFAPAESTTHRLLPPCSEVPVQLSLSEVAGLDSVVSRFSVMTTPVVVHASSCEMRRGLFHLFNWPCIRLSCDGVGIFPSRLEVGDDEWAIEVFPVEQFRKMNDDLAKQGGYALTHFGEIRRTDERGFDSAALSRLSTALHHIFSFTMGRWAGPQLLSAFDQGNNVCYRQIGTGWLHPDVRNAASSWFNAQRGEAISELFPGFMRALRSPTWATALAKVIDWYVSANQIGSGGVRVDNALLFSQAALEVLAWTHCVLDRRMVSRKAFGRGGLSAADKIRLLLSSLGIPKEIPSGLPALATRHRNGKAASDLPDVLTAIRNGLVHPDGEQPVNDGGYYEAWRASQWLIELCVLNICGYRGNYQSRVSEDRALIWSKVPWAS